MSYTALYRKFRPLDFEEVKGQDHIVKTLKNQIISNRIGHAYLFTGTRGTGKTTIAKIFARTLNCEEPIDGSPCKKCAMCKSISNGSSMNVIEIDAASNNGVDNIREIVDGVAYSPAEGKFKVYIIDEVHMLSIGAFNALLKTLEEPPSYVVFILATTEVHKIPITILSRCQRYDFKRITVSTIASRLQELVQAEGIEIEERAVNYIAKMADGSLRDGISLLDQCVAFNIGEKVTFDKTLNALGSVDTKIFSMMLRNIIELDVAACIGLLEDIIMQGRELQQFIIDFAWYLRNLLLLKSANMEDEQSVASLERVMEVSSDNLRLLKEEAGMIDNNSLLRMIRIFSELSGSMKFSYNKRVLVEITFIKLCRPEMEVDTEALQERIQVVEKKLENGIKIPQQVILQKEEVVERPSYLSALPEDIEEVIKNFKMITSKLNKYMQINLKNADVSVSPQGELVVGVPDGIESDYFIDFPERVEEFREKIRNTIQKDVAVVIVPIKNKTDFQKQYMDIKQLIQFEVLEEDEE